MKLKNLDEYGQLASSIVNQKVVEYQNEIKEQIRHFETELKRAELIENYNLAGQAKFALRTLERKLDERINVQPYSKELEDLALDVWNEGEAFINHLKMELQEQISACFKAKELYLSELKKIAGLKKESEDICRQMNTVRMTLRCNDHESLKCRIDDFVLTKDEIERITR